MAKGFIVFSPISHSHPIAALCELPLGWDYWEKFDSSYLGVSNKLVVLMLDGWQTSTGVTAEILLAKELGIEIEFLEPEKL
jgi:hypothetical protein